MAVFYKDGKRVGEKYCFRCGKPAVHCENRKEIDITNLTFPSLEDIKTAFLYKRGRNFFTCQKHSPFQHKTMK